ncbi:MAG: hypothetical protein ACRDLT_12315 [Solirubrobacteraceae bacterium]
MSKTTLAGVAALLAAPVVVIAATLVQPTISNDAATQVAAIADHHGATVVGLAISTIAAFLLIAGTIWFAYAVRRNTPQLSIAGGILGVFGMLTVLFEDGISAAAPSLVNALGPAPATTALDRIGSSGAVATLEPLTIAGAGGLTLLAIGAVKAGAPTWSAVAIAVGAFAETAGFATGTKAVVIVGFVVLLAGLTPVVRTLVNGPSSRIAAEAVLAH